ncbi:MAG: ATP synthase F1 subunit epsilon [Acetobacteraceae bacterium]
MPLLLEIVAPDQLLHSAQVDMAVIPASEGDMGVLEGHMPMIVGLRPGVVSLYQADRIVQEFLVDGGFAEVTGERCSVLANAAVPVADLGGEERGQRLQAAEEAYARTADPL